MSYRDDREALREQLESLRREVESLREQSSSGDDKAQAATLRVNAVSQEVAAALARIDEDRDALKKLAVSLDGLKKTLKAEDAAATQPTRATQSTAPQSPKIAMPGAATAPATSRSRLPVIIGAALILLVGFAFWRSWKSSELPKHVDVLHDLSGAPNAVEWLPVYARAEHEVEAGSSPSKIDIWYVKEDGTLDFTAKAYEPYVTLMFVGKAPPPPPVDPAIPLGAPVARPEAPRSTCFTVNKSDGFKKSDCGIVITDHPLPRPTCSLRAIWAAAKAAGAPSGAVAHLSYSAQFMAKRPAVWHFTIEHTDTSFTISDPECQVIRDHSYL